MNLLIIKFLKMNKTLIIFLSFLTVLSCKKNVTQDLTPYTLNIGAFPKPNLPEDNKLTKEKVKLGKMLFHEKLLSSDNSISCASCHLQEKSFNDDKKFSKGVGGLLGDRNAMSIINMAWNTNGFFWDGRAELLRDQALGPIENPLEMNESLENVIKKLSNEEQYINQFKKAFGDEEINSLNISLAMEQFMFTMISNQSKYDAYLAGETALTESEDRGRKLFSQEYNPFFPSESGADCAHCHGGFNFENDKYMNNGLSSDSEMEADLGRFKVTQNNQDKGKFKVTSLRNIALTAPYMHDGRFNTLMEVLDHYNEEIKASSTLEPEIENTRVSGLELSQQDKEDIIAFLMTLTDNSLATNPEFFE